MATILDIECQYLNKLKDLVRNKRDEIASKNTVTISKIVQGREDSVIEAAMSNTIVRLAKSKV